MLLQMASVHSVQWLSNIPLGEGNGTPLQFSCLENPTDGGAWWAALHGVAKSQTRLSNFTFTHWRRKWQPTPVFLPGESQGWEPGGLPSMRSHRVGHDWSDLAAAIFHCIYLSHHLYPSKTFRLLSCPGCCKQCCSERWGACILLDRGFL